MARTRDGTNLAPGSMRRPARNSRAVTGRRPSRCSVSSRSDADARLHRRSDRRRASRIVPGCSARARVVRLRLPIEAGSCARPRDRRRRAAMDAGRESDCESSRAGRDQSTMPSAFSILWRVGRLGSSCGVSARVPRRGRRRPRRADARRAARGRARRPRWFRPGRSGASAFAIIGPASSALTTRMIVTPVAVLAGHDGTMNRRGAAVLRAAARRAR